jgi:hypothetical protein
MSRRSRISRRLVAAEKPVRIVPPRNPHLPPRLHILHLAVEPTYYNALQKRYTDSRGKGRYPQLEFDVPARSDEDWGRFYPGAPVYVEVGDIGGFYSRMQIPNLSDVGKPDPDPDVPDSKRQKFHIIVPLGEHPDPYPDPKDRRFYNVGYADYRTQPGSSQQYSARERGFYDAVHFYTHATSVPGVEYEEEDYAPSTSYYGGSGPGIKKHLYEYRIRQTIEPLVRTEIGEALHRQPPRRVRQLLARRETAKYVTDRVVYAVSDRVFEQHESLGVSGVRKIIREKLTDYVNAFAAGNIDSWKKRNQTLAEQLTEEAKHPRLRQRHFHFPDPADVEDLVQKYNLNPD